MHDIMSGMTPLLLCFINAIFRTKNNFARISLERREMWACYILYVTERIFCLVQLFPSRNFKDICLELHMRKFDISCLSKNAYMQIFLTKC